MVLIDVCWNDLISAKSLLEKHQVDCVMDPYGLYVKRDDLLRAQKCLTDAGIFIWYM